MPHNAIFQRFWPCTDGIHPSAYGSEGNVRDKNEKSKSSPSNADETTLNTEEPATEADSFMDRALEISERLLREHKERENTKRTAEDKGRNHS